MRTSERLQNAPSVRRMPTYLHKLSLMHSAGDVYASATKLAEGLSLDSIVVRKDLQLTGAQGVSGVGYKTVDLINSIRRYLGWDGFFDACLVGTGSLGRALLGYQHFMAYGLRIAQVFDRDSRLVGNLVHGHYVHDMIMLPAMVRCSCPDIAILCVPGSSAQGVADLLYSCGVRGFWNFSDSNIQVGPDGVVQREVLLDGFATLSAKIIQKRRQGPAGPSKEDGDGR